MLECIDSDLSGGETVGNKSLQDVNSERTGTSS